MQSARARSAIVRRLSLVMAGAVVVALAFTLPAYAQGNSKSKGHKSSPPSSSPLPSPASTASGATPLAWIDDASVLAPGTMSLTISTMRWSGADLSEVEFPVVDTSVGLTPRFQLSASIPRIVGSADGTGPVGGIGTSYLSGKFAVRPQLRRQAVPVIVEQE